MECKVRALFDFVAEGPNELSITAGEILVITLRDDETDWWFVQNSSGQTGAVPATYVEVLPDPQPINTVLQISDSDVNEDDNTKSQISGYSTYQPRLEEEKRRNSESNTIEQDLITDSSFDSSPKTPDYEQTVDKPVTSINVLDAYDPLVITPVNNIISQDQQYSLLGDIITSTSTGYKNDSTYDTPSWALTITSNEPYPVQSENSNVETAKINDENSAGGKSKEKSKLFTMTRSKSKGGTDKRRGSTDNGLEASKGDSDSDDLSDSGSGHNSLSNSNKHSSGGGGGDSKTLARTRFFDKHGVGHYLLHECKTKLDEHIEIIYDENEGGICWAMNPRIPPFTCKIENSSKETKFSGLKSYVEYKIHSQIPGSRVVGRRYKQFNWLYEQLAAKYRFICIPPLPGKQIAGRFDQDFIEDRRRQLEFWLNRICHHPILCASYPVQHFLTCEISEKNNKDWKAGKRKIEKDELREAAWLYCVTFSQGKITDTEIAAQIECFAQQQPALETHLKSLNHNFTKYLERHGEVYERDLQRVGELFTKLHGVVEIDQTTQGNDELASLITKIGNSYNGIAQLYKTKGYEGLRNFVERIQEYLGLLACFPIIISIQRSATEYVRNAQRTSITPDLNGAHQRNQILNHVILAEINFFQKAKVYDLKSYIKTLLDEQIHFYEKITSELRNSVSTLN